MWILFCVARTTAQMNTALAKAIIDSHKKKKTVARLAGMEPYELSRVLRGTLVPTERQRDKLAAILKASVHELFPDSESEAMAS